MLNQTHLEHLTRFRIPRETLEAGCIRSVTDADTRELLGANGRRGQDLSGIYFPYFDPITGQRSGSRVRLDHPDEKMRYLMEEGCRRLFFPRGTPAAWLTDISVPVVLTESEKGALAIYALGERLSLKVVAIATGGVWGWKRKGSKQALPDGGAKYVTAPSPDLSLCTWTGRDAIILFDNNVTTNFEVQWARVKLSQHLESLGAKVLWAEVPVLPHVNGPDDFVSISNDTEAVERMLNKVMPFRETKKAADAEQDTQAAQLVSTVSEIATLFHTEDSGYAVVPVNGHEETWRIGSRRFRQYMCLWYFQKQGEVLGAQAVLNAINLLEAKANFEGPEQEVHVRVAEHEGALWLDLANDKWQAVRITKHGWDVVDRPCVRFWRPHGVLPLPIPERGGSIKELRRFLSLASDEDFVLVVAFLVAALRPRGPYPVLVIVSEHGSGKTTTSRVLRRLGDPNFAATRAEPRENRDLAIACRNSWVVALDNVSKLQDWLSDTLARISTGDAFATRALYTDAEETLFSACRPIILNGITAIPDRPDLLDRSVIVNCSPIPDDRRRPEDELWAEFKAAEPKILGALLDAVAMALSRVDEVKLDRLPRMADFAKWTVAAEPALPWEAGRFMKIYAGNRHEAIEQTLEDDPVADLCRQIADWEGTASDLLTELINRNLEGSRRKSWPYDKPVKVSNRLKRLAPTLRRVGIEVAWLMGHHPRRISITRTDENIRVGFDSSPSSPSSPDDSYQEYTVGRLEDELQRKGRLGA